MSRQLLILFLYYFCKLDEKYSEELTESIFQKLYIGLSLSLIGLATYVDYYLSYIIEERWGLLIFP
jgi:hypothetical protein